MSILLTGDWHWTDRPRDGYRFGLVEWIADHVREWSIGAVVIAGDLTDAKDRHSAWLVNMVTQKIEYLATYCPVIVIRGNHDAVDEQYPFFSFLRYLPNVTYVKDLAILELEGVRLGAVSFHRDPHDLHRVLKQVRESKPDLVVMHQTVHGSVSSSGHVLTGFPTSVFRTVRCPVFSGDIHVPQRVGPVTYIGAPYPIRFDDTFTPRLIVWSPQEQYDVQFPSIRKRTITIDSLEDIDKVPIDKGDQVKIRIRLPRHLHQEWAEVKSRAVESFEQAGAVVFGVELMTDPDPSKKSCERDEGMLDMRSVFTRYCRTENISDAVRVVGEEILNEHLKA